MHTHKPLKLLKLLATSTKLSHMYTLLKDMEETTFQSASKQNPNVSVFRFCMELSQNMKIQHFKHACVLSQKTSVKYLLAQIFLAAPKLGQ